MVPLLHSLPSYLDTPSCVDSTLQCRCQLLTIIGVRERRIEGRAVVWFIVAYAGTISVSNYGIF